MDLSKRHRILFMGAGMVYVMGAICVESLSGLACDLYGTSSKIYGIIVTVEEFLEMLGIIIFIYALLHILRPYLEVHRVVDPENPGS